MLTFLPQKEDPYAFSHILKKKVIWLGAAKQRMVEHLFLSFLSLSKKTNFSSSSITFDVKGNLSGLEVGTLNFQFGIRFGRSF